MVYQDLCNCEVYTDAHFASYTSQQFQIENHYTNSSTQLNKAWLIVSISRGLKNYNGISQLLGMRFSFNGRELVIDQSAVVTDPKLFIKTGEDSNMMQTGIYAMFDVTDIYNSIGDQTIIPYSKNQTSVGELCIVDEYFIVATYINNSLSLTNLAIVVRNSDTKPRQFFRLGNKVNPLNRNQPIGLTVNLSNICSSAPDSSLVYINDNYAGSLSSEDNTYCSGASGSSMYSGNDFVAFENDDVDSVFKLNDGVAEIKTYLQDTNLFDVDFKYYSLDLGLGSYGWWSNPVHNFTITGIPNCQDFDVTVPDNIELCKKDSYAFDIQGGNKYEWFPKRGLSCYDCPNPVAQTDSSRNWQLTVWSNDSCRVIRNIQMRVIDMPKMEFNLTKTECGTANGQIDIPYPSSFYYNLSYSLNGGSFTTPTNKDHLFDNLAAGDYTLVIKSNNDCQFDTLLTIEDYLNVKADFDALPAKGKAPHTVYPVNKSKHFDAVEWFVDLESQGNTLEQFTFFESGEYEIQLVATKYDESCADTVRKIVYVYEDLILEIPNVFTPNGDGTNDQFSLVSNLDVEIEYTIQNRWGETIKTNQIELKKDSRTELWTGELSTEGVYFYRINVLTKEFVDLEFSGFVHLEK